MKLFTWQEKFHKVLNVQVSDTTGDAMKYYRW